MDTDTREHPNPTTVPPETVSLGALLQENAVTVIQRWYERWRKEGPAHEDVPEAALKDLAPLQLGIVAEALLDGTYRTESPQDLWRAKEERLAPELRLSQNIPIEEIVREYWLLVSTIRDWLQERAIVPPFAEYTYFYEAIFELVAESVRRFAIFQAEAVRRERGEYLAGVAHQMRTPVSVLALGLSRLKRAQGEERERVLAMMTRNLNRLTTQVNAVMRLERYGEHELPVRPEPVSPADLIDEVVFDLRGEAERKALALDVRADHAVKVKADPELLGDAVNNLVSNAIKYTEKGLVHVEMREKGERIEVRVEDTGPGIEPERRACLFKPVHPSKRGGVGIGLAVAFRAVKAQGGDIGVETAVGRGSTFWFSVPKDVRGRE